MLIDYQSLTNKVVKTSYFFRTPSRFQYHQCYWLLNSYAAWLPRHPAAPCDTVSPPSLHRSLQGAGACSSWIECESYCWDSWGKMAQLLWLSHDGSDWCCQKNGVPWIPSIYPSHVSIYSGMEFSPVVTVEVCHGKPACRKVTSSNKVGHFIENSVCVHNRKRVTVKMGRLIQPSINDG